VKVHLICPGLFGGPDVISGFVPPTPALDRLLARADREETSQRDPLETLAAVFDVSPAPGCDLPSAPLSLLAEAPDLVVNDCWYHADPVHLRADRDQLLLFGGPPLGVTQGESDALVTAFNAHFGSDGLELVATEAGHWYLRTGWAPDLLTEPLYRVTGRPVVAFPAQGADARVLGRWQNEAQMLFYSHRVNEDRETAGRPTINGVWTWGGGVLPEVTVGPDLTFADHPLALGLALAQNGRLRGLGDLSQPNWQWGDPAPVSVLIFLDALWWPALALDAAAWLAALSDLETLILRLSEELAAGRVSTLILDDGQQWRFTLTRWGLRRFWRRGRGLREWDRGVP
jgi:hypothetical protein